MHDDHKTTKNRTIIYTMPVGTYDVPGGVAVVRSSAIAVKEDFRSFPNVDAKKTRAVWR